MERQIQADNAFLEWMVKMSKNVVHIADAWYAAVKWADSHPKWYDAQGDIVPEYGKEVIVIGRDGKVFYGHRPDPKEYVVIEGKKCFANTYDKNGWNWPDIALWLDVEIPHELIEQITDKWFEENEQRRKTISD